MSPLTALAIALSGGIIAGAHINAPLAPVLIFFFLFLLGALVGAFRPGQAGPPAGGWTPGTSVRASTCMLAAFFFLGACLVTIRPGTGESDALRAQHENPTYKVIAGRVDDALAPEDAALFRAIVFGDPQGVAPAGREDFRRAGLLHVFAASGFNVTLAAAFVMFAARRLRAPKFAAGTLGLMSIGGYFWLVGPSPSVTRATVMACLLYLGLFFGRRIDPLASMAAAAVGMLAWSPSALFDIGWQLSFASLLGIFVIHPRITRFLEPRIEPLTAPLTLTLSAQLGVTPILLYYFGQLSTVAVLANPIVTAAIAVITGVGFAASVLSLLWQAPAQAVMAVLGPLLGFVRGAAEFFGALPAATVQFEPSFWAAIVFTAIVGLTAYFAQRRFQLVTLPAVIIFVIGLQAGGIWLDLAAAVQRVALSAEFLDVGQGDATLIRARDGGVVLVDGGDNYRALDQALRQRGVKRIDLLILSHPHADHLGALDEIIRTYPVGRIIESGWPHPTSAYRDFRAATGEGGVPVDIVRAGRRYRLGRLRIDILWPPRGFLRYTESDVNNNSVVAKVEYDDFALLLPGDIEREAQAELLAGPADLSADVLKVAHQGADNGTTNAFLRRVRPRYAVIPVGKGNPYGHPHRSALARLRRYAREIARTDRDGDVFIGTDGRRIEFAR